MDICLTWFMLLASVAAENSWSCAQSEWFLEISALAGVIYKADKCPARNRPRGCIVIVEWRRRQVDTGDKKDLRGVSKLSRYSRPCVNSGFILWSRVLTRRWTLTPCAPAGTYPRRREIELDCAYLETERARTLGLLDGRDEQTNRFSRYFRGDKTMWGNKWVLLMGAICSSWFRKFSDQSHRKWRAFQLYSCYQKLVMGFKVNRILLFWG